MPRARRLIGRRVLAVQEGEVVGRVQDFLVHPETRRLAALILESRGWGGPRVVPVDRVRKVGPDFITIPSGIDVVPLRQHPTLKDLQKRQAFLRQNRVVTEDGVFLGRVRDLELDESTLELSVLLVRRPGLLGRELRIPAERIVSIGRDAIVVREEVEEEVPLPPPAEGGPTAALPPVEGPSPEEGASAEPSPEATEPPPPEVPPVEPSPESAPETPSVEPSPESASETSSVEPSPESASEKAPDEEKEKGLGRWFRRR